MQELANLHVKQGYALKNLVEESDEAYYPWESQKKITKIGNLKSAVSWANDDGFQKFKIKVVHLDLVMHSGKLYVVMVGEKY